MRVGIDYRAALHEPAGPGRYARELVRGLCEHSFGRNLGLFGYGPARRTFGSAELGIAESGAELVRLRLPERWLSALMRRLGKGADDLVGGATVFHHLQPTDLRVRDAVEVVTILDCSFVHDAAGDGGPGYEARDVAALRTARARALVARAKRVIVPSEFVGAEAVMALGAHPDRVATIELGCDHIARDRPPPAAEAPGVPRATVLARQGAAFALTVGRVEARKNHVRMLRAFELLVREGLVQRWIVVGPPGHGADDFERALAASPARDRVDWRRRVPEVALPELYDRASVFLFASLHEGFGLPAVEALACGTPVVASCITALPEILGDAAFLVEPTDPERIFEAARRILTEPEIAASLATRGRARARRFTWKEAAKHTLLAYRAALENDDAAPKLRRSL